MSMSLNDQIEPLLLMDLESLGLKDELDMAEFVSELLAITLSRSTSRRTRKAAYLLGTRCVNKYPETSIGALLHQISRPLHLSKTAVAPVEAYICLKWINLCLASRIYSDAEFGRLLIAQALLLDSCVGTHSKQAIRRYAKQKMRSNLAKCICDMESGSKYITSLTQGSSSTKHATLLGEVLTVLSKCPYYTGLIETCKKPLLEYFTGSFLSAKEVISPWSVHGLDRFLSDGASNHDVETVIAPIMIKAILRAPEFIADPVLVSFVKAVRPSDPACTRILISSLLLPILGIFKSSNRSTRHAGVLALKALQARADELAPEIVRQLVSSFVTDRPGVEFRHAVAESLNDSYLGPFHFSAYVDLVLPILVKEPNESVHILLISALLRSLLICYQPGDTLSEEFMTAMEAGIKDKRAGIRNQWLCGLAEILTDRYNAASAVIEAVAIPLVELWTSAKQSPVQALQNGMMKGLYAVVVMFLAYACHSDVLGPKLRKCDFRNTLYTEEGARWLFGERTISKLVREDERAWLLNALDEVLTRAGSDWKNISNLWASAVLSLDVPERRKNKLLYCESAENRELLSFSILNKIAARAWDVSEDPMPSLADWTENALRLSLHNLREDLDASYKDLLLMKMLVLAHHQCFDGKLLWIELCQSVSRDPSELVDNNGKSFVLEALEHVSFSGFQGPSCITGAALRSISSLAFVSSGVVIPIVVDQFQADLNHQFRYIDAENIAISQTPVDQVYATTSVSNHQKLAVNRNERDWQTVQWEDSVRAQIAARKAIPKKLTKEEQNRLDTQLHKEQQIRIAVNDEILLVRRGVGLIQSLNQLHIQAESWFAPAIACLLSDNLRAARNLLLDSITDTFLRISLHARAFGTDARLIGLAVLESLSDHSHAVKRELINRALYKLRSQSEQASLDFFTCAYMTPLIARVLIGSDTHQFRGITGCDSDSEIEEQVFLVLEVLRRNTDSYESIQLDRIRVVDSLIRLIESRPSQSADAKELLANLFRAMATNVTEKELRRISAWFCAENFVVRNAVLSSSDLFDFSHIGFVPELWLAQHDDSEANSALAKTLFEQNNMTVDHETRELTLPFLSSASEFERNCASRALAHTFTDFPDGMSVLLQRLKTLYYDALEKIVIEYDRFGQIIPKSAGLDKTSVSRIVVITTFSELSSLPEFGQSSVVDIFRFFFASDEGANCPAADQADLVRSAVLAVGTLMIQSHGHAAVQALLPVLETALLTEGTSESADWIREAGIIFYGATASYLAAQDSRIPRILEQLLNTLKTPTEAVQVAIARCLPPLIAKNSDHGEHIHNMLNLISDGRTYAERRGAAYGLSGIVRGCGLSSLRSMRIMDSLDAAVRNKKDVKARQGALFAYECFALILGNLWEPYVQEIIPLLLLAFADNDAEVRAITQDTAKAIMSSISDFGVRSILPSLISGLDDHQWRSKKGSIELLGAMAYCAPRQLSRSLPTIIPRLNEVLTDSHAQVRAAGNASLTRFGEVISNPEIQHLVPVLLKALSDPIRSTEDALDQLLKTSFLHYIDSSSLSILIPIVERGLQERSASTKKKSSKIFGLLATLTAPNDLIPHLNFLVPCLRQVLVDTVPDVRATAAKAFGSLVGTLGERNFPDLISEFLVTLNSEVASTDRQGAAQGLSEVLAGLGVERLEDTLPKILKDARSPRAYVREGFISLLIYLPATFGPRFAPYLAKSTGPILSGLADESEFVRDASLRAGKIMIANYVERSVELMLPELERGLLNDSWRIRVSSLQLLGDLLYKISGIATKSKHGGDEEEEDDAVATEAQRNVLLEVLGQGRRDRVFSFIYIVRFDSFAMVRSSAINVWKTLVANTPKTLREILSTLIDTIISSLAIKDAEKRAVFVECLGDLMRKMGRDLLSRLLPAFEEGLRSSDANRIGVCVAITEVIHNCSAEQMAELETRLISAIKLVLVDHNSEVRLAARDAFDSLQTQFGPKIIDQVLPDLLSLLQSNNKAEDALEALKGLMQVRAHVILPILLPGLMVRPMSGFSLQAIGSLARVAGQSLVKRLQLILMTILDAEMHEAPEEASRAFENILLSLPEGAEAVTAVMNTMLELVKNENCHRREHALIHLATFFGETHLDFSRYIVDSLRVLMNLMTDGTHEVVIASWQALDALTKSIRKEEMAALVSQTRIFIQHACPIDHEFPGFSLPKGLGAILPLFLQGLLYGNFEQKEEAAKGLGDIIQRTEPAALRGYVTQITGPLIRVMGERSGSDVKSAILTTLHLLLQKIPAALKPFLPQLQRTFTKSLADTSPEVRLKAAVALGSLISLQSARVDSLITELISGIKSPDLDTRLAMLSALEQVIDRATAISPQSRESVLSLVRDVSGGDDLNFASRSAGLLGVLFRTLDSSTQAKPLLSEVVLVEPCTEFAIMALNGLLLNSSEKIIEIHAVPDITQYLTKQILSTRATIAESSIIAAGKLLLVPRFDLQFNLHQALIHSLATCISSVPSNSSDTQRLSLVVIRSVARTSEMIRSSIGEVGLVVFGCVRSTILPVKLAAESAFVAIFKMTENQDELLRPFLQNLNPTEARRISEYSQRVAFRVAAAENERKEAGIEMRDDDMDEILGKELTT